MNTAHCHYNFVNVLSSLGDIGHQSLDGMPTFLFIEPFTLLCQVSPTTALITDLVDECFFSFLYAIDLPYASYI